MRRGGKDTCEDEKSKVVVYKYGDKVRITRGFYEGKLGYLYDEPEERYDYSYSGPSGPCRPTKRIYAVTFCEDTLGGPSGESTQRLCVKFTEGYLEKVD